MRSWNNYGHQADVQVLDLLSFAVISKCRHRRAHPQHHIILLKAVLFT